MTTMVKQVPKLKDCNNMDLRSDPNSLAVMKKPMPLKAFGEDAGLHSRKNTEALALQIDRAFTVNASWSEKPLVGKPGDWLVQYGKGDFGIVDRQIFKETYDILKFDVSISAFTDKQSISGNARILNGLSLVYKSAYENSQYWPLYGTGPGQERIPYNWGRLLSLDVLSDPKGGAVFVARDKSGNVLGSLIAVNFASIMDSHSPEVQPAIDYLKAKIGEEKLRNMWYIVDLTVKPETEKAKHSKGAIELGAQQMGIGTQMIEQFERFIKGRGAVGFVDWTSTENIPMREGMYKRMGITELPGGHIGIEANVERADKAKDPKWYEEGETSARYAYKLYLQPMPGTLASVGGLLRA